MRIFNKSIIFAIIVLFFMVPGVSWSAADPDVKAAEESFKKAYPNAKTEQFSRTDIDGFYEFVSDGNVFYYHPKSGSVFIGDIIRAGRSLTAARRNQIASSLLNTLPLDKAITIGKGKKSVIEFSDPDCPFCRRADAFLSQRKDVTIHLFLYPLSVHKDARKKSLKVLCSADKEAAYRDVMSGKFDNADFALPAWCEGKESAVLDQHLEWGRKLGVNGTPAFWINGERVDGADMPRLEKLLADKN